MSSTSTLEHASHEAFEPPPRPPPLLDVPRLQYLVKHGYLPIDLPPKLVNLHRDLQTTSKAFFQLELQVKRTLLPATQGTELGYYHVEDEKEYMTFRHANQTEEGSKFAHTSIPDTSLLQKIEECRNTLEALAQQTWFHTAAFLHRVLVDLSYFIDIEPSAWDPTLDGCLSMPASLSQATPSLLRTFLYEPDRGIAAPHKDNGLLTLCVGNEKGLQVWKDDIHGTELYGGVQKDGSTASSTGRRGYWEDATGPTILVGTTLTILSSERIAAGSHRVVANPVGRSSTVFALRPSTKHKIDLAAFGGEGTWDMLQLWRRITKGRVNVNAHKQVRDDQQRERDARQDRVKSQTSPVESYVG